jgi:Amt family ammonium transporter
MYGERVLPVLLLFAGSGLAAQAGLSEETVAVVVQAAAPTVTPEMFAVNNTWMLVATFLVFVMHLGFASVESGLTRAKNTTNILFKNTLIPAIGILVYAMIGFNLMYPGTAWEVGRVIGFGGFGIGTGPEGLTSAYNPGYTYWTDFLFQGMFAATAATIVSGAVAERVKLGGFLLFSAIYVAFVYPVVGSWGWGGGWLKDMNFHDFAGSTFVHSVGGWAALAGVIVVGPRLGKYVNGKTKAIMGHSMPLATIGVFLLWLGWFGFNGGSVLSADPGAVSYVFVTTTLGACAGIVAAMIVSWILQKKPDHSMVLNGCLAGLVAITAGADVFSIKAAILVGAVGGVLVVFSVFGFDRLKLDDPVGALSVHLVCGVWGTLAVGIFCDEFSILAQLAGIGAAAVACFVSAYFLLMAIRLTIGIRVSEEEELRGLDIGEHGMEAYNGFQIFSNQ